MGLYKTFAHKVAWPVGEKLAGLPVRKRLEFLLETERWPREKLEAYRNERFRAVVNHAAETVPFYRKLWADHGVTVGQIQNVADAPKLPPVSKDMLRAAGGEVLSRAFSREEVIRKTSSGSTGEPFRYYLSKREKAIFWANLIRNWGWAGYELGDKITLCTIGSLKSVLRHPAVAWIELGVLRQQFVGIQDLGRDVLGEKLERIRKFGPKVMRGYASSLYHLAKGALETGPRFSVPSVVSTSETLTGHMRETIVSAFDTTVYDQYGAEGMIISSECDAQAGMHVNEECVFLEIVDDKTHQPADRGEVVLTNLEGYAYPFIRYRVMDVAAKGETAACPCGRTLARLGPFEGRVVDFFPLANGRFLTVPPFCDAFGKVGEVITWQIRHVRPDHIRILVHCRGAVLPDETRAYMERETRKYTGEGITFDVDVVDRIPPTSAGKRRYFVSELDDDTYGYEKK
ncbi:MAG: hypothetical protein ABIK65_15775 [Candidatus Eisenbacteria bacterium]